MTWLLAAACTSSPLPAPLASQASLLSRALTKDIAQADSLVELQDIAAENADLLDAIHVATIFTRAQHLAWADSPEAIAEARQGLAGLVPLWLKVLPDAPMTAVSTLLLSASKLSCRDPQLWSASLAHVMEHMQQTTGFDVCNILFAAARIASAAKNRAVPGIQRQQLTSMVLTLIKRMRVIVLAPRDGDRLTFVSITNCFWALAKFAIIPDADALVDLLVEATTPRHLGSANGASYADLLWGFAVLQSRHQLFGRVHIPRQAEAALFAQDKVRMTLSGDTVQVCKVLYSLGMLVQAGALQPDGAVRVAGLALMADLETRSDFGSCNPVGALWGAAVLQLPVQRRLLNPSMLQYLSAWAPRLKGQYVAPLAELLLLTGCRQEGLLAAALKASDTPAVRSRPDEALALAAAMGAAVAHHNHEVLAWPLLQFVRTNPELKGRAVPCTAHTRQQLQATHAWLCQQQVGGGRGLTGLVHPSLLEGSAGKAGDVEPDQALGPISSRSGGYGGSGSSSSSSGGNGGQSKVRQMAPAGQQSGGEKERTSGPGSGSSPPHLDSSGTAVSSSGTAAGSSSDVGSNHAARPAPAVVRVPFGGGSSKQLMPRPQR
jgi:hypothetical protein